MGVEAVRLATKYMTPVIVLSDTYLAHAAEPWRIPEERDLTRFPVRFRPDPAGLRPFQRDPATRSRPWALPGTPGLEHRIGGIEKDFDTGHISYDPGNHHRMTQTRAAKIAGIARDIPPQDVALGETEGALAVVGWGSTFGAIHEAVRRARGDGLAVSHIHVRYLSPFPKNLGELLRRFERVLADIGAPRERTVFVSGIGCAARFPYYISTYGFHTIHGRAPTIATGIKLANPELDVWVVTGDGDALSIGGNHLLHVLRRNVDL